MRTILLHCVLIVLSVSGQLVQAAITPEQAAIKQIELLKKLADEGVVEARRELAKRAIRHVQKNTGGNPLELKIRLADGAYSGDLRALHQLAHLEWVTSQIEGPHNEAILIIATAGLLGHGMAAFELEYLAQSIYDDKLNYNDVLHRAMQRIKQGKLFDCIVIQIPCKKREMPDWLEQAISSQSELYQTDSSEIAKLLISENSRSTTIYTRGRFNDFVSRVNKLNEREEKVNETSKPYSEMSFEEKKRFDRKQNKERIAKQQAEKYLSDYIADSQSSLAPIIESLNHHRSSQRKLIYSQLADWIQDNALDDGSSDE